MTTSSMSRRLCKSAVVSAAILSLIGVQTGAAFAAAAPVAAPTYGPHAYDNKTKTPIKHVIIVLGENRTFDHVFATYQPVKGETVSNLLSKGIVKVDGTPGANYGTAMQKQATDIDVYQISPKSTDYKVLPPALVGGPAVPYVCQALVPGGTATSCDSPTNEAIFGAIETGLASDYLKYGLTGGTGVTTGGPDPRISYDGQDASHLPPGPYQITSATHPYDAYDASPVHRLFQMWQQLDCNANKATKANPSGCALDLFPWVEATVGAGANGAAAPASYQYTPSGEGSVSTGFYNVAKGDAPYLTSLANAYTMSDNYHQAVLGGTGANHVMIGTGDAIYFSNGDGTAKRPPINPVNPNAPGTLVPGFNSSLSEEEDPNPQPGTNNWYTQDGYGGGAFYGSPANVSPNGNYGGGSYVKCADNTQPGIAAVQDYLAKLPTPIKHNCEPGHFYLVNNYNPGYFGDGSNAYTDTNADNTVFTIPPSSVRNIGDELIDDSISWAYFGDQFNVYLGDKYDMKSTDEYCNICNWAQYSTSIMTDATKRADHLHDLADIYTSISEGKLPAVSYVKPSGIVDGHPASSKLDLFEGFTKKLVDAVQANSTLAADTAIFITFDEGGGYWDSGYVQPLDFFGDGPRIPMIVVSAYSQGGHITHTYTDHVSTLKFIEANWGLSPITNRSRDNFPNPKSTVADPYVPTNSPALGDMMDMFRFDRN